MNSFQECDKITHKSSFLFLSFAFLSESSMNFHYHLVHKFYIYRKYKYSSLHLLHNCRTILPLSSSYSATHNTKRKIVKSKNSFGTFGCGYSSIKCKRYIVKTKGQKTLLYQILRAFIFNWDLNIFEKLSGLLRSN